MEDGLCLVCDYDDYLDGFSTYSIDKKEGKKKGDSILDLLFPEPEDPFDL